jgi:hypothetical protein
MSGIYAAVIMVYLVGLKPGFGCNNGFLHQIILVAVHLSDWSMIIIVNLLQY